MKTVNKKTEKVSKSNPQTYTVGSTGYFRVRDYKRAMRKHFNEMKRSLTMFSTGMESMPAQQRNQVKDMMRKVDATHRQLMKWWSR
jgi:hypothetical protein